MDLTACQKNKRDDTVNSLRPWWKICIRLCILYKHSGTMQ